ncbi:MAG: thiamine pyrophosphate-dependent enzyme [Elusimicrobiota bacterium]
MAKIIDFNYLKNKAKYVKIETLKIHKIAPETRLASSLSPIEILVTMFHGKIMKFNKNNVWSEKRDRFIISKPHGVVCMYPILADLGVISKKSLSTVCQQGSKLGGIPDFTTPGFETINGSLGHGIGVACGIALALKAKRSKSKMFVLMGDGELYEGSVWEAIMFAGQHKLDNLILVIDKNGRCMLDFCNKIIDLDPLDKKFNIFGWQAKTVDGHDMRKLHTAFTGLLNSKNKSPKVLIAETIKGKSVPSLEKDEMCHIRTVSPDEIDRIIKGLK